MLQRKEAVRLVTHFNDELVNQIQPEDLTCVTCHMVVWYINDLQCAFIVTLNKPTTSISLRDILNPLCSDQ